MTSDREIKYFCFGLGVGIAGALMWAPKSGAEVRRQIQDTANEGSNYLKDQAESVANAAADVVDRGTRTVRHHKENLKAAVDAGKQAYREASASTPATDY
jgi:gas vesicle protein